MSLIVDYKYSDSDKGLLFSSADRRTLYYRQDLQEKFTVYTKQCNCDCGPSIRLMFDDFSIDYLLTELPILITDASQLPADVKRTDDKVWVGDKSGPVLRPEDMLYLQLRGAFYYVRIADIPYKDTV